MNDVQRLNLYRHPILQAIYDVMQAIELCGASPELTEAVVLAGKLSEQAATILDERDALRAKLRAIVEWLERNRPEVWREGMWDAIRAARAKEQK